MNLFNVVYNFKGHGTCRTPIIQNTIALPEVFFGIFNSPYMCLRTAFLFGFGLFIKIIGYQVPELF